ncbi:class I adenylate-forming enzyme family protein [Coralliovum pocilloporae]|uniref:class I adenylate-forming enzyme family protein n=1 Tax=Coralliovum pocilloporae TaxID=3066369 RepID=UPI00330746B2
MISQRDIRAGATPAPFNLIEFCLRKGLSETPDKPALIVTSGPDSFSPELYTYKALSERILAAHQVLAGHLERGDRVLVDLGNCSLFPIVFFGAISAGLVPVPLSDQLSPRERAFIRQNSGASLGVCHDPTTYHDLDLPCLTPSDFETHHTPASAHTEMGEDDPAFLIYTSGTSGHPKGVLHAHRTIFGRRPMAEHWFGLSPDDQLLHAGAFNWTYTLGVGLMDPWAGGATSVVFTGEKTPEIWPHLIEHHKISLFAAVPSLYRRILKYNALSPDSMPSLRHALCAGESLGAKLYESWTRTTGREIYEALGMSECSTYISASPRMPVRPGSSGHIQPGRKVTILDEDNPGAEARAGDTGLIAIHRSEAGLMLGYWDADQNGPKPLDDWFLTGDRASMDEDGYVWHAGRADDVMNASGYRVAAEEVEQALSGHPVIEEIAVTTTITENDVELITAFVIVKRDQCFNEQALNAYAAERLADYKRPRLWIIRDNFPRTASGKLMRKRLRQENSG